MHSSSSEEHRIKYQGVFLCSRDGYKKGTETRWFFVSICSAISAITITQYLCCVHYGAVLQALSLIYNYMVLLCCVAIIKSLMSSIFLARRIFLLCCISLINHHSTRALWWEHCEALTCVEIGDVCMLCTSQYQRIKQLADGESWIYPGWSNLLNCCSCPFIIINQRAAGPKEQFRALQSYAIAESVISLRKII